MENASKALIMAGAVLLALMIISLGVLIFNKMSGSVRNAPVLDKQAITSFNSQLTPYFGEHISGSQVNNLIQTAISIDSTANKNNDDVKQVTVKYKGTVYVSRSLVSSNSTKKVATGKYYKVSGTYSDSGLITEVNITD